MRKSLVNHLGLLTAAWLALAAWTSGQAVAAEFSQPDLVAHPNVFLWTDTCNVWVLRDGDSALLIDLGDGSVLEQLPKIAVNREGILQADLHLAKVGRLLEQRPLGGRCADLRLRTR